MQEPALTKKQKFLSRIALGAVVLLLGLFLLLCGSGAINLSFLKILPPAVLLSIAVICFSWAFIQDNTLTLWLSLPFALSACVSVLAGFTAKGYGFYYPFYIFAPAAASLVTAIYSGRWRDHLKVVVLFGGLSVLFTLNSMFDVSWRIVLPLAALFLGVCITISALWRKND